MAKGFAKKTDRETESGLRELQDALAKFLSEEKSAVFLTAVIEKAARIIEEECSDLELYRRARALSPEEARARLNELHSYWKYLQSADEKLIAEVGERFFDEIRELAASQLAEIDSTESEELSARLVDLIRESPWHLSDEIASKWATVISRCYRDIMSKWRTGFSAEMKTRWDQITENARPAIEDNLREIEAIAANAFDSKSSPPNDVLPRFSTNPMFSHRLYERQRMPRRFNWRLCLPARIVARSLKRFLTNEAACFFSTEREQAVAAVSEAAKQIANEFLLHVNDHAKQIKSRMSSAILGNSDGTADLNNDAALRSTYEKLLALRDGTAAVDLSGFGLQTVEPPTTRAGASLEIGASDKRERKINFESDLKTRGCAVCDHVVATAFDFFAQWQYAISTNEQAQTDFANEHGFCPLHMWQLHSISSTLGQSIGLTRLAQKTAAMLRPLEANHADLLRMRAILRTSENCRLCQLLRKTEAAYIEKLAAFVKDRAGQAVFSQSHGLCLYHVTLLMPHVSIDTAKFVIRHAVHQFETTTEDMQQYAIKRDALRRNLTNKDEEDAYLRTLIHLAGAKDFCTPWPEDREI